MNDLTAIIYLLLFLGAGSALAFVALVLFLIIKFVIDKTSDRS